VSLAAGLVAGWLAIARAGAVATGRRAGWLSLLVLVSSLPFVVWSVAGLETGLAALCATGLALAVIRQPHAHALLAGSCTAALAWLRPELLAFAGCLLVLLALRDRRAARLAALVALLGLLTVLCFRQVLFDHLLPMTASAKPALLGNGVRYLGDTLARPRVWVLLPLWLLALVRGGRGVQMLCAALLVHALAVVLVGGDWMPGRRLFAPLVPVLALATALGTRGVWVRRPRWLLVVSLLLITTGVLELVPELLAVRAAGATRAARVPALARLVCNARGPVALVDLGVIGVSCPEQTFLDLGGLTEPKIAYARGGHLDKQLDPRWLRAQKPGLLVLHSQARPRVDARRQLRWFSGFPVERRVLAVLGREFEVQAVVEYQPAYFYVVMRPVSGR
jgi:hypothetical protein